MTFPTPSRTTHPILARYEASLAGKEGDTVIPLVSNAPKYPVFVSESGQRNRNKWGSLRGYKIQTHPWPYHLLPPDEGYGRALGARGA